MKQKTITLLLALSLPTICFAQLKVNTAQKDHYRPFLEDGKEWICRQSGVEGQEDYDFRYYLDGDTVIGNYTYKKCYTQHIGRGKTTPPQFVTVLREDGPRVYSRIRGQEHLTYDFSMEVGQETLLDGTLQGNPYEFYLKDAQEISFGNNTLRCLSFASKFDSQREERGFWIEGVGSTYLPFVIYNFHPGYTHCCLQTCKVGSEVLYDISRDIHYLEDFSEQIPAMPYHPMLKEGKQWNYIAHDWRSGESHTPYSLTVIGDTLIEGRTCKKIYKVTEAGAEFYQAWYEEDRHVYCYTNFYGLLPTPQFIEVYDFNRTHLNDLAAFREEIFQSTPVYLLDINVIKAGDTYLNRHSYGIYSSIRHHIVEGVGGNAGLYPPQDAISRSHWDEFVSCYEDGKCLCTAEEMSGEAVAPSVAGIGEAGSLKQNVESRKQTVFDLGGRKVSTTDNLRPGIYIRNGKKVAMK